MKLSIITLTHNKLEYTKKYIESLYKYTKDFELIIVDNGSNDGTVEYLKTLTGAKLILNEENLGFSKGNNQAIKIVEGEFVAFLNNDILLSPNWFEECEKIFRKENAAFVSPRQINPEFHNTNDKKYLEYFKRNFSFKKEYEKHFEECSFSCVVTKKEILSSLGNFDENYTPAFFEDDDFKYRAINNNYGVFVSNTVCFFHYGSVTSKKFNTRFEENRKYYYNKYPFAEYLSVNKDDKFSLYKMKKRFSAPPLKQIYFVYLLLTRIKNRIKNRSFKF